jgi:hypothetical protein
VTSTTQHDSDYTQQQYNYTASHHACLVPPCFAAELGSMGIKAARTARRGHGSASRSAPGGPAHTLRRIIRDRSGAVQRTPEQPAAGEWRCVAISAVRTFLSGR